VTPRDAPAGVRGWLLVLCLMLLVWQPVSLGLVASTALDAVAIRGTPLALLLFVRLFVAALGIAAGLALLSQRPSAPAMARAAIIAAAATDTFVYSTSIFPSHRMPGDTPIYVAASLTYHAVWLTYLLRSKRVRNTFDRLR